MTDSESRPGTRRAVLSRAAALRARQAEEADAAGLAWEAREELEQRGGTSPIVGVGLGRSHDGRSAAETATKPVAR